MKKEKLERVDLVDKLSELTDNAVDAFEALGHSAMDKLDASADKAGDAVEKISDRLGNSWLMHKIDMYQARQGLLGGDRKFAKRFSNEILIEWRKTRQDIAEGFRKQAQSVRERAEADNDKSKDTERFIEHDEALAEGLENDVGIIDEELKERGVEL